MALTKAQIDNIKGQITRQEVELASTIDSLRLADANANTLQQTIAAMYADNAEEEAINERIAEFNAANAKIRELDSQAQALQAAIQSCKDALVA